MKYGYVSYMDILGFASNIKLKEFHSKYNALLKYVGAIFGRDRKATIYIVSDSIIVTSEAFESVSAYTKMIYSWGLKRENDFWIRGAIAQGKIEAIDPAGIVRPNGNIIIPYLGNAYLRAVELEEKINMAGIVIDSDVKSDNPDLPVEIEYADGFMEYREYLIEKDYEGKKRYLLPSANSDIHITDSLHFQEMLKSHASAIDKYINTFCFYIKLWVFAS